MRTTVMVVVLAGLCFSVGEGLRLLPLPHAASALGSGVADRAGVAGHDAAPRNQFKPGSLCLPPQAQKNCHDKRTHWAPASGCVLPLPAHLAQRRSARRPAGLDLTLSLPGPAGRAPPRTA